MDIFTNRNHILCKEEYSLSNKYNPEWVLEHQMGPNVLWLLEWLVKDMSIKPGMRILDLGCGKALSSIFLASEFDIEVWAADLWIDASDNLARIEEAGLGKKVFPINAEAHALPFAKSFFDAIISIDSYHYFGTDQMYLGYLQKFLKPSSEIGIALPGLHKDFENGIPAHLTKEQSTGPAFWQWDCCTFHTAAWWKNLWSYYPFLTVTKCESLPDGGKLWFEWEKILHEEWDGEKMFPPDTEALVADNEEYITFTKIIAKIADERDEQMIGEMIGESLDNED